MKDVGFFSSPLAERDPEIFDTIGKELGRQRDEIELIASENIVSAAVLEAQGSVLTNKYAEGYPGKRYYGGLPVRRHRRDAGDRAGEAALQLRLRQRPAQLRLPDEPGGVPGAPETRRHLHGARPELGRSPDPRLAGEHVGQSGFNVVSYGVRQQDQLLDMEDIRAKAREHKPKLILAGGTAYSRIWDWAAFREIADEVGAYLMVDMAHIAGLVAGRRASLAPAPRPCLHHDHAQVAPRPPRRDDPDE
jgi:glycine hydroxymethyltransferase